MDIITVEKRNEQLKAKQLRRKGIVPCCIFGGNLPNSISIQMEQKTADKLLRKLRLGSKVQLKLEDQNIITQIKDRCFADSKVSILISRHWTQKQRSIAWHTSFWKMQTSLPAYWTKC